MYRQSEDRPKQKRRYAPTGYSHWHTHKYERRSIEKNFLTFCEWDTLVKLTQSLDPLPRALVCTLFETGGRAEEILTLKPEQIDLRDDEVVWVRRMKVVKHREKQYFRNEDGTDKLDEEGERMFVWVRKAVDRTFPLARDEPLLDPLLEYVQTIPTGQPLFDFGYSKLYKIIRDLEKPDDPDIKHGPWWPHRFRGERATQLVREKGFTVLDLMEWFGWKRTDTPTFYVGLTPEDLKKKIVGKE